MDDEQMSYLRKMSADVYRKNHGLLTSEEIIRFQPMFGMSQTVTCPQ
jgi:hypothetical protein